MAAITNPGTRVTEFSGEYKLLSMYNLALASASEALTLSYANNGISEIQNVVACVGGGADGNFAAVIPTFSGLVVTLTSLNATGAAATAFGDTKANVIVIGK